LGESESKDQVISGDDLQVYWDSSTGTPAAGARVVSGLACLSNDGVNFVSAVVMASLGATIGTWLEL